MCDFDNEKDMTKLEAYLAERPIYADVRRRAYAEVAINDLVEIIVTEMEKPPYYISGEESIPILDLIDSYIGKMQEFRKIAPLGKRAMFNVAIDEAERLSKLFIGKDETDED